jgi:hypothetical protein
MLVSNKGNSHGRMHHQMANYAESKKLLRDYRLGLGGGVTQVVEPAWQSSNLSTVTHTHTHTHKLQAIRVLLEML